MFGVSKTTELDSKLDLTAKNSTAKNKTPLALTFSALSLLTFPAGAQQELHSESKPRSDSSLSLPPLPEIDIDVYRDLDLRPTKTSDADLSRAPHTIKLESTQSEQEQSLTAPQIEVSNTTSNDQGVLLRRPELPRIANSNRETSSKEPKYEKVSRPPSQSEIRGHAELLKKILMNESNFFDKAIFILRTIRFADNTAGFFRYVQSEINRLESGNDPDSHFLLSISPLIPESLDRTTKALKQMELSPAVDLSDEEFQTSFDELHSDDRHVVGPALLRMFRLEAKLYQDVQQAQERLALLGQYKNTYDSLAYLLPTLFESCLYLASMPVVGNFFLGHVQDIENVISPKVGEIRSVLTDKLSLFEAELEARRQRYQAFDSWLDLISDVQIERFRKSIAK